MTELKGMPGGDVSALVMAFIDDEASPADAARARVAIAASPGMAADAEMYRGTGRELSVLFEDIMAAPVPDRLLQTVWTSPMAEPAKTWRKPLIYKAKTARRWDWMAGFGLADLRLPAASLASAAIAFSAGCYVSAVQVPSASRLAMANGLPVVSGALEQALTVAETGHDHSVEGPGGSLKLHVVSTFRVASGDACREYDSQVASGPRIFGIACRQAGAWRVTALLSSGAQTSEMIRPASDLGPQLDEIAGAVKVASVTSAEEQKLIAGGWDAAK